MTRAAELVARYGYLAIFCLLMLGIVGPLIPDETILVFAGIMVREGRLDYAAVLAAGYAGSLCGITMSYFVGRKGLLYLFQKIPHFRKHAPRYMEKVHTWFERYGRWTLFFGYFVVGIRHFTAVVAGASKMRMRHFAIYAYTGGFIWVICFVSLGYFLGDQWERVGHTLNLGATGVAIIVAVGVGLTVWWKKRTANHSSP
jgi:membrane protein DedA with SNARE-associated domain